MNKMIVLGNYEDLENKNNSNARVYDVGGDNSNNRSKPFWG